MESKDNKILGWYRYEGDTAGVENFSIYKTVDIPKGKPAEEIKVPLTTTGSGINALLKATGTPVLPYANIGRAAYTDPRLGGNN